MIPTEYLRQVPIQHRLSVVIVTDQEDYLEAKNIITGYKTQRAWWDKDHKFMFDFQTVKDACLVYGDQLLRGEEVEGFKWIDLPIVEGEAC